MAFTFTKILLDKKNILNKQEKQQCFHGISISSEQTKCQFGNSFATCTILNNGDSFKVCEQYQQVCIAIRDGLNIFEQLAKIQDANLFEPKDLVECDMIKMMIRKGREKQTL